jgi:hypothetical protein
MNRLIIGAMVFFTAGALARGAESAKAQLEEQRNLIRELIRKSSANDRGTMKEFVAEELGKRGATISRKERTPIPEAVIDDELRRHFDRPNTEKPKPVEGVLKYFGGGLSIMMDLGSDKRVKNATIDDKGFIRIEEDDNLSPRPLVEGHVFLKDVRLSKTAIMSFGPYAGIVPAGEDIIDAIGVGVLMGFRRVRQENSDESQAPGAFQLGVGFMIDPGVQVLGRGLKANTKIDAGETLRYRNKDILGIQFALSFGY